MSAAVYILYSESTDRFYRGMTCDIEKRLKRHNCGYEKATKYGRPWALIWKKDFTTRKEAYKLERKLKNLSRDRLIEFVCKYNKYYAGPDKFLLLEKLSGC